MRKALILGTAALAFSAVSASAADLAPPPAYGYGAPGYGYAAPGYGYAAPAPSSSTVVIVAPAPAYTAPLTTGYYAPHPVPPAPIPGPVYDYAPGYGYGGGYWGGPGYWGGYGRW